MKFTLLMIIVLGISLLASTVRQDGTSKTDGIKKIDLPAISHDISTTKPTELKNIQAFENQPAEPPEATEIETPMQNQDIAITDSASDDLPIEAVLTKGVDYTRQQLKKDSNKKNNSIYTHRVRGRTDKEIPLRNIHSLNREALSTLARVDAILSGRNKGDTQ